VVAGLETAKRRTVALKIKVNSKPEILNADKMFCISDGGQLLV
jgi:hypothetical protein